MILTVINIPFSSMYFMNPHPNNTGNNQKPDCLSILLVFHSENFQEITNAPCNFKVICTFWQFQ